jgi:hypothetical protein
VTVAALIATSGGQQPDINITRYLGPVPPDDGPQVNRERYQITRLASAPGADPGADARLTLTGPELAVLASMLDDLRDRGWRP